MDWWFGKRDPQARQHLEDRLVPREWRRMPLPDVTSYYDVLEHNIDHRPGLPRGNRDNLMRRARKHRRFLAGRADEPPSWWRPQQAGALRNAADREKGFAARQAVAAVVAAAAPRVQRERLLQADPLRALAMGL